MALLVPHDDGYSLEGATWRDVAPVQRAMRTHDIPGFTGVDPAVGRAALFGSAAKFEGRNVSRIDMSPLTMVPYDQARANVDWDRTEHINQVPIQEVDPARLSSLHASQPSLIQSAMNHYLNPRQFGGDIYAQNDNVANDFPTLLDNEETGDLTALGGHHRLTAAIIMGRPLRARIVRGRTK